MINLGQFRNPQDLRTLARFLVALPIFAPFSSGFSEWFSKIFSTWESSFCTAPRSMFYKNRQSFGKKKPILHQVLPKVRQMLANVGQTLAEVLTKFHEFHKFNQVDCHVFQSWPKFVRITITGTVFVYFLCSSESSDVLTSKKALDSCNIPPNITLSGVVPITGRAFCREG